MKVGSLQRNKTGARALRLKVSVTSRHHDNNCVFFLKKDVVSDQI